MGRHGPVPEPVATRLAKGETRPSRINYEAPHPDVGDLRPPDSMTPEAKRVWRRVVKAMRGTGVLTEADTDILRVYCDTVVRYERWHKSLYSSTPLLTTSRRRGEVVRNPLAAMVRDLADQMRLLSRELGLSPSARASLRIDSTQQMAELDAIIGPPPRLRVINE